MLTILWSPPLISKISMTGSRVASIRRIAQQRQQHRQAQQAEDDSRYSPSNLINHPSPPLLDLPVPVLAPNAVVDLNSQLDQTVLAVQRAYRPDNTKQILERIQHEFFEFCDATKAANDSYSRVLNGTKVYRFMFYQTFREQKKKGGKRK